MITGNKTFERKKGRSQPGKLLSENIAVNGRRQREQLAGNISAQMEIVNGGERRSKNLKHVTKRSKFLKLAVGNQRGQFGSRFWWRGFRGDGFL